MKYIIMSMVALLSLSCAAQTVAQERQSRHLVKSFVTKNYPSARSVRILGLTDGFRLTFQSDGYRYQSKFSMEGAWVQTDKHIRLADMPAGAQMKFDTAAYRNAKVVWAREITSPQYPGGFYLLDIRCNQHNDFETITSQEYKLYYTNSGSLSRAELVPDTSLPFLPWEWGQ